MTCSRPDLISSPVKEVYQSPRLKMVSPPESAKYPSGEGKRCLFAFQS